MTIPGGRWIALQALNAFDQGTPTGAGALEQAWGESGWPADRAGGPELSRERGLAMELVYGVLRWEMRLDAFADRLARKGGSRRLNPVVRRLFHLGLYQLLYLDRIPPHAAVSETVGLAKVAGVPFARGFLNAVLRRVQREGADQILPPRRGPRGLAQAWSHPLWVVKVMEPVLGSELEAWLEANQAPPPITLRAPRGQGQVMGATLGSAGVSVSPGRLCPDALILDERVGSPTGLPGFDEGRLTVQDEGAQLLGLLTGAAPGERVLDACAAPGGKTAQLAEAVGEGGTVWATDLGGSRMELLRDTLERLGHRVELRTWVWGEASPEDGRGGDTLAPDEAWEFDGALVDAPCSAWGLARRFPEVKARRGPEEVGRLAEIQLGILRAVAPRVRPGGWLVYGVCSPLPAEGEEVLSRFLSLEGAWEIEAPPAVEGVDWAPLLGPDGALRTWPHRHGSDGFFGVRLRRRPE